MDMELAQEDLEFGQEVRTFFEENLTDELRDAGRFATSIWIDPTYSLKWQAILHKKGWVAPGWPVEYGGTGWTDMQRYIYTSECSRASTPLAAPMGVGMVAYCIMGYGTQEQKDHYLPRILSGEDYWCQGYSEPGAGSDLASLKLQAVSDGDDYVLNGTKIWTSQAHCANKIFILVRTRNEGKPQAGITFLLMDMDLPGIEVSPIINIAGEHELNQVFFTDVRVPKTNRLGDENDGWTVAKYLLEFERGGGSSAGIEMSLAKAKAILLDADPDNETQRLRHADLERRLEAIKMTEKLILSTLATGGSPGGKASMLKTIRSELGQDISQFASETAGIYAQVFQPEARQPNTNVAPIGPAEYLTLTPGYLTGRASTIAGGSAEVQRNIIAKIMGL
ncbi:MAG: acyl-CoA dehydrogenase [Alphaproteobacteria bacterium]|nr:MAG: acyl-CoA dehydrogenase [Alphaproteobacteria bacterium]